MSTESSERDDLEDHEDDEVGELFKINEDDIQPGYVPDRPYSVEELIMLSPMKNYVYHNFVLKEHIKVNKDLNLQREEIKEQIKECQESRKKVNETIEGVQAKLKHFDDRLAFVFEEMIDIQENAGEAYKRSNAFRFELLNVGMSYNKVCRIPMREVRKMIDKKKQEMKDKKSKR